MHVFLSYAREDRDRARVVASALDAEGWSVRSERRHRALRHPRCPESVIVPDAADHAFTPLSTFQRLEDAGPAHA